MKSEKTAMLAVMKFPASRIILRKLQNQNKCVMT